MRVLGIALLAVATVLGCSKGGALTAIDEVEGTAVFESEPTCKPGLTFSLTKIKPTDRSPHVDEKVGWQLLASCPGNYVVFRNQSAVPFQSSYFYETAYPDPGLVTETVVVAPASAPDQARGRRVSRELEVLGGPAPALACTVTSILPPNANVAVNINGTLAQPAWPIYQIEISTSVNARVSGVNGFPVAAEVQVAEVLPTNVGLSHTLHAQVSGLFEHGIVIRIVDAADPTLTASCMATVTNNPVTVPPTARVFANGNQNTFAAPYYTNVPITWDSTNATACTLAPLNKSGLTGNEMVPNILRTTKYDLTCNGPGGAVTVSVNVTVACPANDAPVNVTIDGRREPLASCAPGEANCTNMSRGENGAGLAPTPLMPLKPGYALRTMNYTSRVQWGRLASNFTDCPNYANEYPNSWFVTTVLQFANDAGVVQAIDPAIATYDINKAARLNDYATAHPPPVGATRVYGAFPNQDYSRTSGQCNFQIQLIPFCNLP